MSEEENEKRLEEILRETEQRIEKEIGRKVHLNCWYLQEPKKIRKWDAHLHWWKKK